MNEGINGNQMRFFEVSVWVEDSETSDILYKVNMGRVSKEEATMEIIKEYDK